MEANSQKDIRIAIRIEGSFKEKVEAYCQQHGVTLSDFMRVAAMEAMKGKKIREKVVRYRIEEHKARGRASRQRIKEARQRARNENSLTK
jgi:antitoxin component of RelBE/YafQ-DinJ toxin-antitoxin module